MNGPLIRVLIPPVLALVFFVAPWRFSSKRLLSLAFFLWLLGGLALMVTGVFRLGQGIHEASPLLIGVALGLSVALGWAKGKFLLSKTSQRNIDRILALEGPQKLIHVYSLRSWIVIELMLLLSASLTGFGAPVLWRGVVNVAVGLALIVSSLKYCKTAGCQTRAAR